MSQPSEIRTYVFFDLESTGLPEYEFFKTKISEIALVACSKDHLLKCQYSEVPRVLHKQTLCFNPQKRITDKSEEITGMRLINISLLNKYCTVAIFRTD
jgi:DNA polymerase III epsilon subunit-like protein